MTTDPITQELLRLAREQTDLLSSQFLAPVKPGCNVLVRLAGKWCSMMIVPPSFEGWGVFRPLTRTVALCCREATTVERSRYLSLIAGIRGADLVTAAPNLRLPVDVTAPAHCLGISLAGAGDKLDLRGLGPFFRQNTGGASTRWN
jgi:hypothetical protein